jgi:hypothetical protein
MANPLTVITSLGSEKSRLSNQLKGVVKRDWVPTGRIDFATKLDGNDAPDEPGEFKLLVEERRVVESIAGNENLEIQWRLATLKEAKSVVTHYHKYLTENSLIKSLSDPELLPPEPKESGAPSAGSARGNGAKRQQD